MSDFFVDGLSLSRRQFVVATCLLLAGIVPERRAHGAPEDAARFLEQMTGTKTWRAERMRIILPPITDQWRFVPITVEVDGPWDEMHMVRSIHLVAERNPTPHVVSFHLSPECWPPRISTRLRLVRTQVVVAAAILCDGSVLVGKEICKVVVPGKGCG